MIRLWEIAELFPL